MVNHNIIAGGITCVIDNSCKDEIFLFRKNQRDQASLQFYYKIEDKEYETVDEPGSLHIERKFHYEIAEIGTIHKQFLKIEYNNI